jgi:hypothetical protein
MCRCFHQGSADKLRAIGASIQTRPASPGEALMKKADKNKWQVIDYEVQMYFATRALRQNPSFQSPTREICLLLNAMVESQGLHTRILCEFCLSKVKGDIQLQSLVSDEEWKLLEPLVTKLGTAYGKRENSNSPRVILNQMLMHPTDRRGPSYTYDEVFNALNPRLDEIIARLRLMDGRFELAAIA